MGNSHLGTKRTCLTFIFSKIFQNKFSRLIGAIKTGNLTLVKYYYAQKVNFNQYLNNGDTPLHVAVKYNQFEIVKFIAENVYYLNLNDKNFIGDTPLMLAILHGNLRITEYLVLKKNVDVNIPESRGFTPFIAACANGYLNLVKFLVKNGCNIRAKSKDGQTALHRAAFYGHIEVIRYLVKKLKMNVLLPDRKGNLPLHYACMKLRISCIRLLCKASKRPVSELLNAQNIYGVKPVDILVKLLNRLRLFDEPQEFSVEQIEEYIRNKKNYPNYKRTFSPIVMPKSIQFDKADMIKSTRRKTISSHRELLSSQTDNSIIRPRVTNESYGNIKTGDFLDKTSPTEEKFIKETEEEDPSKFKNFFRETPVEPPFFPLVSMNLKRHSAMPSGDNTPRNIEKAIFKIMNTNNLKDENLILRVNTKIRANSVFKSTLVDKKSATKAESLKDSLESLPTKSRFAIQNNPVKSTIEP